MFAGHKASYQKGKHGYKFRRKKERMISHTERKRKDIDTFTRSIITDHPSSVREINLHIYDFSLVDLRS